MDIKDILKKLDTIDEAQTPATSRDGSPITTGDGSPLMTGKADVPGVPTKIVPTHFHKGNLGNIMPLMMTEPGVFWWEGSNNDSEGGRGGGRSIQKWSGNTKNRSAWNPASVDGVYVDGKPVEFPEGVTWDTYKPAVDPNKPVVDPKGNDDYVKLNALVDQLEKSLMGQGSQATPNLPAVPGKSPTGQVIDTRGGINGKDEMEESIIYRSSIAQSLTESFGYDYEGELNEYSLNQLGSDVGDFGRGAWNGVTLGAGDNIYAGVKSALGGGTYKDNLAKQTAASKEAEQRSPWLYGAGNVAGSLAIPVPGGAIAGGLIKGASTAAKVMRGGTALGINLAAQHGVDVAKNKADTATLGYDPNAYPTTPQAIMAFQKANGLTADGKIGPKTQAVLAKMGLKPEAAPTAAESMQSLRDRLAMIESQPQTQVIRVWLTPENLVFTDDGEQITDTALLENIQWPKELLAEKDLKQLAIGKGADELEKLGSKVNLPSWLGGQAAKDTKSITNIKPSVVNKAKTGNANIKDQTKYVQGRAGSGTGSDATKFAKYDPKTSAMANADQGISNMVRGGVASRAAEAEKAAGALGKEGAVLSDAEKAAASAEAKEASRMGKLKDWIKANPKKAIALGLLAGTIAYGLSRDGGGGEPPGPTPGPTPGPHEDPSPVNTTGGLTPEQQDLIKQIKDLELRHGEDESPDWVKATSHAQVVLDKAEKKSPEQTAMDQSKDTASTPFSQPAGQNALDPEKNPNPATSIPSGEDALKTALNPKLRNESSDAELSRWLKIARGQ